MKIDTSKFTHCFRVQIAPSPFEDDRIASVIRFCKTYGFDNVMLFINAEEYNIGHMTCAEAEPWIKVMKKAAEALRKNGITVSLNPWNCILHLDRGRTLKEGQNFVTMTDSRGTKCTCVVCPLDKNWREYFLDFSAYLVRQLQPEIFWVEDDFRIHNHAPLDYGGCFCQLHMEAYSKALGYKIDRAEFADRLLCQDDIEIRKAWLDVNRSLMSGLAGDIGKAVRRDFPDTEVGLMSSDPRIHCLEGRDWRGILEGLSQGGKKIDRIHLPCYEELCGSRYYVAFHTISMQTRAMLPPDTYIYPELENGSFSELTKSGRFLQFQLESALPLCLSGMTYDIYDFTGNGEVSRLGYGDVIRGITPYLQAVTDLHLCFESLQGVKVLIDETSCYTVEPACTGDITQYKPADSWWAGYFGAIGVTYAYSTSADIKNDTVAVCGQMLNNLTESQIKTLFAENFVLLDGMAVMTLQKRGFLHLIGAERAKRIAVSTDVQSFEQAEAGVTVDGIEGYRVSCQEKTGDYVQIDYSGQAKLGVYSQVFDAQQNAVGKGIAVIDGRAAVLPYVVQGILYDQYSPLRLDSIKDIIKNSGRPTRLITTRDAGISAFLYQKSEKESTAIFVNTLVETKQELVFDAKNLNIKSATEVGRRDGMRKSVMFDRCGDTYTIRKKMEYLATSTFVFETEK